MCEVWYLWGQQNCLYYGVFCIMEVESYEVWYLWDQENCSYYRGICIKVVGIREKEKISSRG